MPSFAEAAGKTFQKVLIANRGEIAVRVIRALREFGIRSVAVFSQADRKALHVLQADEAVEIGPPAPRESYLNTERLLDAAKKTGAQAIHPGYGFLSENEEFAQACADRGITFIGPPPKAIHLMGSKTRARELMAEAGVPIVPGMKKPIDNIEDAKGLAREIGYPVLLKAAGGGGGKGMRIVEKETDFAKLFERATSEAKSAFGRGEVYMEKYVRKPRHIEIQVFADAHGHAVHLGERECSIQRRYQKVVEECPSPFLKADTRRRMGEAAVQAAKAVGYVNAGTVEFVVDPDQNFYFLEMNTRLQVEHPVTELVNRIDLVKAQLGVAAGAALPWTQEDIRPSGWAIECRIYAEDPSKKFFPAPGTISRLHEPSGPWVRVDSGIYEGWTVPVFYDPLLAKLVTWGVDRLDAVGRMKRALGEFDLQGIRHNIPFLLWLMDSARFRAGDLDTHFIDDEFLSKSVNLDNGAGTEMAALAAAVFRHLDRESASAQVAAGNHSGDISPWLVTGRKMALR
ncbi:MAG: acetyl-CoA carboxylase biotin carboxylase subunit [Nitrospirae bacterium]|nr:acetyl-CoA carboxylase biotin carboxylase subunit [Nitrospirota bacterium]